MNRLEGHIGAIRTCDQISRVTAVLDAGQEIQAVVIETPETAPYLKKGSKTAVLFKETEVILCLPGNSQISEPNQIPAQVDKMEAGILFTWIGLRTPIGDLGAIIPSESVSLLGLTPGKEVIACVKTTEVMLSGL
ncbi:TOBE domain-containing protein [Robiginitalea sp.]|uniref:TOBE domain-containing protein n=1 Tax=Robiginitalea sp. TaxID=1902411 RepID=UPI003C70F5CA